MDCFGANASSRDADEPPFCVNGVPWAGNLSRGGEEIRVEKEVNSVYYDSQYHYLRRAKPQERVRVR